MLKLIAIVLGALAASSGAWAQSGNLQLLLPGDEYHQRELPPSAQGTWWALHKPAGQEAVLQEVDVNVTPVRGCGDERTGEQSGRTVTVPAVRDAILLIRGPGLTAGPVPTVFVNEGGSGEAKTVEAQWNDQPVIIRHFAQEPQEGQRAVYRLILIVGDRQFLLRAEEWDGDGHWLVRWIGDLNRDGWPDLLLDASEKYSVHTSRLFVSQVQGLQVRIEEAAALTHVAC